jgi:hypothetical protein
VRQDAYNFWDLSLLKNTRIRENVISEFRFKTLNALKQMTLFGQNTTTNKTAFGQVTAQRTPRHMQMTVRLQF